MFCKNSAEFDETLSFTIGSMYHKFDLRMVLYDDSIILPDKKMGSVMLYHGASEDNPFYDVVRRKITTKTHAGGETVT